MATGKVLVEVSPEFFRPAEVDLLLGDPTKARETLGWNPRKTSFDELVKIMTEHDIELVKQSGSIAGALTESARHRDCAGKRRMAPQKTDA